MVHIDQIRRADGLISISSNTPWRFGWSWGQGSNHNHWSLGNDGKLGMAMFDDDNNGLIDDFINSGPRELGKNNADIVLSDHIYDDWPLVWQLPFHPFKYDPNPLEEVAFSNEVQNEDNSVGSCFQLDWGDPGKNHKTLRKYND